jgi:hypothetical protein
MVETLKNLFLRELKKPKNKIEALIVSKTPNTKKVIFEIPRTNTDFKSWVKIVEKVDITKIYEYVFERDFINA